MRTERQRQLNMDVTSAIILAESTNTLEAWQRVVELEQALSTEAPTRLEMEIAARGVITAQAMVDRIKQLAVTGTTSKQEK
jgi:hypothetical protein